METLIRLLERKNLCFRNFNKLCLDFIDEITRGDMTNLEQFQRRRQGLINVLEKLEIEIGQCLDALRTDPAQSLAPHVKNVINQLFRERESFVRSILDLDLRILTQIDRIKDETIQKLQSLQVGRKSIGAYRSPIEAVETAERNKSLDREA